MTKEEVLIEIQKLDIINKIVLDVYSNKEYKIVHVSESIVLNSKDYNIQVTLKETPPSKSDKIRVELYSTIQAKFIFV